MSKKKLKPRLYNALVRTKDSRKLKLWLPVVAFTKEEAEAAVRARGLSVIKVY